MVPVSVWCIWPVTPCAADKTGVCHIYDTDAHPSAEYADCHDGQHLHAGHLQVWKTVAQTGQIYLHSGSMYQKSRAEP